MIVYLHPHFEYPGGASRFVLETAKRLTIMGTSVVIVAGGRFRWPEEAYPEVAFKWVDVPVSSSIWFWVLWPLWYRRVRRVLDALSPTTLFPQVFPSNYWAFVYRSRHRSIRCVWYCHEPSAFVHDRRVIDGIRGMKRGIARALNPLLRAVDVWLARYADEIVANSIFTAERARAIYGRCDHVVYPGIDIDSYILPLEKSLYYVSVARLTRFKRIDLILEALEILRRRYGLEPLVKIIGEGDERDDLIRQSQRLGVQNQVEFLGRLSDEAVRSTIAKAKAALVPATDEPFGLVPIEAMAAGTAVIASNSGGPRETIRDGITGYLFDPGDADSLAKCMAQFEGEVDAMDLGRAARDEGARRFTWATTAQQLASVLCERTV